MRNFISEVEQSVLEGAPLSAKTAEKLFTARGSDVMFLFASANRIREHYCGNEAHLCGIINAKSGACSEDCIFCAQSAKHHTGIDKYQLLDADDIVKASRKAAADGARSFGIVTAWKGLDKGDALESLCKALKKIKLENTVMPDLSTGIIKDPDVAYTLAEAGAVEYNINLESGESFYPQICTTHSYEERVQTIKYVKAAGMRVCCGGIFGLGETSVQRVELAETLRELKVDTVPVNFYHHVEGNAVDVTKTTKLTPFEALKIPAVFRFMLPEAIIKIAGGRESTLGEFQSLMLLTGANATMVGNYLTTEGRSASQDLELIKNSGYTLAETGL
ncbi:MAG: biotin synthase BioB [Fibrobacteria bacterium]|nr:biotin synthase BioB [Fibrobacteria bacterium]